MPGLSLVARLQSEPGEPLGPADDPAAYRKQQRHPRDYRHWD